MIQVKISARRELGLLPPPQAGEGTDRACGVVVHRAHMSRSSPTPRRENMLMHSGINDDWIIRLRE
jgi:hypothetical protein